MKGEGSQQGESYKLPLPLLAFFLVLDFYLIINTLQVYTHEIFLEGGGFVFSIFPSFHFFFFFFFFFFVLHITLDHQPVRQVVSTTRPPNQSG